MNSEIDQYRLQYLSQLKSVEGIKLQAIPLYDKLLTGVKTEIPVLFRLLVGDLSQFVEKKPVHICLVLDRSGSMSGNPLNYCKKAIKHCISQLDSQDKVSCLVYDDQVDVIFSEKSQSDYPTLFPLIDQITDRGFTNISGALEKAAEILNKSNAGPQYQKIVFLFSDGEANRGIISIDDLGKSMAKWVDTDGIRFSSFGIGTQYNEKWMRSIARGGEGNYFFIDNVEAIPSIVEKGLAGFTQVIGTHVNFKVSGVNGHVLTSLQNDRSQEALSQGKNIPYLRNLGLYQFLTTVEVNPQSGVTQHQAVLEGLLTFVPLHGMENLSPQTVQVIIDFTNDCQLGQPNGDVLCYQAIGECATLNHKVDEAMKLRNVQEAIKLKKEVIAIYEKVLDKDPFGVIGAMMAREKKTLEILEKEGLTQKASKTQEYTTSYGYSCTSTYQKSNWESKKKAVVEEDADMGYGLFD